MVNITLQHKNGWRKLFQNAIKKVEEDNKKKNKGKPIAKSQKLYKYYISLQNECGSKFAADSVVVESTFACNFLKVDTDFDHIVCCICGVIIKEINIGDFRDHWLYEHCMTNEHKTFCRNYSTGYQQLQRLKYKFPYLNQMLSDNFNNINSSKSRSSNKLFDRLKLREEWAIHNAWNNIMHYTMSQRAACKITTNMAHFIKSRFNNEVL